MHWPINGRSALVPNNARVRPDVNSSLRQRGQLAENMALRTSQRPNLPHINGREPFDELVGKLSVQVKAQCHSRQCY